MISAGVGVVASAAAFALAGLARETTLLFPILYGLSILAGRPSANPEREWVGRVRQALGLMAIACLPFVAWIIVDYSWLGVPHPDTLGVVWNAYASISRQGIAIVLAALLCVPYLSARSVLGTVSAPPPRVRMAVTAAALLCLVILPGALYGGFARVSAVPRRAIATHPHIARDG